MSYKLAIYGIGNMGKAILKALIDSKVFDPNQIVGVETNQERIKEVEDEVRGAYLTSDPVDAQISILAVKPVDIRNLASKITEKYYPEIVVSIAAGVPIATLQQLMGDGCKIFRAMPNIAAKLKCSATALSVGSTVNSTDIQEVSRILSAFGEVAVVNESLLDIVTAISGSGPAYFAYLAQAMFDVATKFGLDPQVSLSLIAQTMLGAAQLIKAGNDPLNLIAQVSSPKGTTVAAINYLNEKNADEIIKKAVEAAYYRAKELANS